MEPYPAVRPRVLITASQPTRDKPLRRTDVMSGRNYADAVIQAGMLPLYVAPYQPDLAASYLDGAEAVLLSGGGDVDPARFEQVPHPGLGAVDAERDAFEIALYLAARERGVPVLGVCRGMQVMCVAEGGSLHQHLPALPEFHQHDQADRTGRPLHAVRLRERSALRRAYGGVEHTVVNSYHHQGVDRLPPSLIAVAHTPDGLVEGVEARDGTFALGVQWHPEMQFPWDATATAPFRALAEAARDA